MKKLLIICLSCFTLVSTFTLSTFAQSSQTIGTSISGKTNVIEPRSDILEWVYKTINGKKYKRLWNATQGRWITDWLPV